MEVEGDGVSFTNSGRTRDSKLGLFHNRPDLVYRYSNPQGGLNQHQLETGRGSPPKLIDYMRGESLTKLKDWIYNSQSME